MGQSGPTGQRGTEAGCPPGWKAAGTTEALPGYGSPHCADHMPCSLRDPCACPLTFSSLLGSWPQPVLAVPPCPPWAVLAFQIIQFSFPLQPKAVRHQPLRVWRGGFILCRIVKVRQSCQGALCTWVSFSPVWDTWSSLEPSHHLPCKAWGLEDAPRDVLPGQQCPLAL